MGLPVDEAHTAETSENRVNLGGHPSHMDASIPAAMDEDGTSVNGEENNMFVGFIGSLEPPIDDDISQIMLQEFGGFGRNV